MGFLDRFKRTAESSQATTSNVGAGPSPDHIDLANRAKWLMSQGRRRPRPHRLDDLDGHNR